MTNSKPQISKKEAIRHLWKMGELSYKLHDSQLKIKDLFDKDSKKIFTILCSRQLGKTYYVLTIACSICNQIPNAIIKYICPKQKQGKRNIKEVMFHVLNDCPDDLKPEWFEGDLEYRFPNGSKIQVAGTDNGNHENLRGGQSHLCIVDEAGFCDELTYVVLSVLMPTTLHTNGKILLVSTPSKDPNHEFMVNYVKPALIEERLQKLTIHDNPRLNQEQKQLILETYPGRENDPDYRREYLCEITMTTEDSVIPEFNQDTFSRFIDANYKKPPYYDAYTSGDIGFRDLTAYLFGYYDYLNATLVIEDELILSGIEVTTENIANKIKQKEAQYFFDPYTKEPIQPFLRVMDNDLIMINDLILLHKLHFIPTKKDDKEAAVNHVRMLFSQGKIKIHPRCKHLIYHLTSGTWHISKNSNNQIKSSFCRLPDINKNNEIIRGGHIDTLDALIYMVRNLIRTHNPYPQDYGRLKGENVHYSAHIKENQFTNTIKQILNIKK